MTIIAAFDWSESKLYKSTNRSMGKHKRHKKHRSHTHSYGTQDLDDVLPPQPLVASKEMRVVVPLDSLAVEADTPPAVIAPLPATLTPHRPSCSQLNVSIPLTIFQTLAAQDSHSLSEHKHHKNKKIKKYKKHHREAVKQTSSQAFSTSPLSNSSYQQAPSSPYQFHRPVEPKIAPIRLQVPKSVSTDITPPTATHPSHSSHSVHTDKLVDSGPHMLAKHHKHKDRHHRKRPRLSDDASELNEAGQTGIIESTRGKTMLSQVQPPKPKYPRLDLSLTERTPEKDIREVTPLQIHVTPRSGLALEEAALSKHKKKKKKHKHGKVTEEDFTWEIIASNKTKSETTQSAISPPPPPLQTPVNVTVSAAVPSLTSSFKTTPTKGIVRPCVQNSPGKQIKGLGMDLKDSSVVKTTPKTVKTVKKEREIGETIKSEQSSSLQPLTPKAVAVLSSLSTDVDSSHITPSSHVQAKIKPPQVILSENALKFFLKNLHHLIQKRDTDSVFCEPVTDDIAPNYSSIIKQPVDLATMADKIENNHYPTVNQFKDDFVLMCTNAMTYNAPETMYYSLAKQLLTNGLQIISKETSLRPDILHGKLASAVDRGQSASPLPPVTSEFRVPPKTSIRLDHSSPFLCQLDLSKLNTPSDHTHTSQAPAVEDFMNIDISEVGEIRDQSHLTKVSVGVEEECSVFDRGESASDVLAQVSEAAQSVKENLSTNKPGTKFCFFNRDDEGKTMLNILDPDNREVNSSKPVDLTELSNKVRMGNNAATVLKTELPMMKATPVSYLMYGPFGSFAPVYDSVFASLSKMDSDLVLSTYGSELGVSYAHSLQQFVKGTGSFVSEMAEAVLNGLTSNRHSKFVDKLKGLGKEQKIPDKVKAEIKKASPDQPTEVDKIPQEALEEKDGTNKTAAQGNSDTATQEYDQPEPREYDQPEPREYDQPEPREYDQPEPREYDQPEPREYDQPKPRKYDQPEPREYDQPEYDHPEPQEYDHPESQTMLDSSIGNKPLGSLSGIHFPPGLSVSGTQSRSSSPQSDLINVESNRSSLSLEDHDGVAGTRSASPTSASQTPTSSRSSRGSSNSGLSSPGSDNSNGNKTKSREESPSKVPGTGTHSSTYAEQSEVDTRLQHTSDLLEKLQQQQNSRLSLPPMMSESSGHVILAEPSQVELETAGKVRMQLASLTAQACPGDLVSIPALHQAMGISMQQQENQLGEEAIEKDDCELVKSAETEFQIETV